MISKIDLITFEEKIVELFLRREIRSPVHLSKGNEEQLIEIFRQVEAEDWVFSTHRSHHHALLKGIPPYWLEKEILEGRSIHIFNSDYKFFSSAIVGGALPIALGVAMAIKRNYESNHVWVFVGDMAAETGIFHESTKYAARHQLPISFVIEDNHYSTNTPTQLVWGNEYRTPHIIRYDYKRGYPHVGAGKWVTF